MNTVEGAAGLMPDVKTAGDALGRLAASLEATNVLSKDYRNHVLGWAYKAVELADKAGRERGAADAVAAIERGELRLEAKP
jgi:hypothetical protein